MVKIKTRQPKQPKEAKVTKMIEDDAFVRELKEAARREQLHKFITKYAKYFIVLVLIVVIISVGGIVTKSQKIKKQEKYTYDLYKAVMMVDSQDFDGGKKALQDIINDSSAPSNIRALASLRMANLLFIEGKFDESTKLYLNVRKDKDNDAFIRDLAGILVLNRLVEADDSLKDKQINQLITELTGKDSHLKYFAMEQQGIFAIKKNDIAKAVEIFKILGIDSEVPSGVRTRAKDMLAIYENQVESQENK